MHFVPFSGGAFHDKMPSKETVIETPFFGGFFVVGLMGSCGNCQGILDLYGVKTAVV